MESLTACASNQQQIGNGSWSGSDNDIDGGGVRCIIPSIVLTALEAKLQALLHFQESCEKLKRMPIYLPLLENGQPSPPPSLKEIFVYPKKWWESVVEWEHPNAKDVLRPFVN
ncbi:hypothetical protein NC651_039563 [Populus alba x Populus x berolinensis]|nr:hypothetical protein NC651_039563 [Populus alba x Populus x berolinensis]